jgi:hypothetical protein
LGSSLSLVSALFIVSVGTGSSETVIQIKISNIIQLKINKQEKKTKQNLCLKYRKLGRHLRPHERMRGKNLLRAKAGLCSCKAE